MIRYMMCMTNGSCGEILIIYQHETKSLKHMLAVWGHWGTTCVYILWMQILCFNLYILYLNLYVLCLNMCLYIRTKTLDIFIIDIDHLNMDLWISSSLHRQPEEGPQWVPGSCNILCFLFNKIDSWLDKSMKPRFGRIVAILLGIKNCVSQKTTVFDHVLPWSQPPLSMSTSSKFPCVEGINKNHADLIFVVPWWTMKSYDEAQKVKCVAPRRIERSQTLYYVIVGILGFQKAPNLRIQNTSWDTRILWVSFFSSRLEF